MEFYGENKKIYITADDDYTHAIIINTIMPELKIPNENVLGLAFEPIQFLNMTPEFVNYAMRDWDRAPVPKHLAKFETMYCMMWSTLHSFACMTFSSLLSNSGVMRSGSRRMMWFA